MRSPRAWFGHQDRSAHTAAAMGIRARMLISFSLLLAVSIGLVIYVMVFGFPLTRYSGSYGQERAAAFRKLALVADLERERLELWLKERKGDAEILTDSALMGSSVDHARQVVLKGLAQGTTPDALGAVLLHDEQVAQVNRVLKLFQGTYHPYEEIQLVEGETGIVLASTDESQLGQRLEKEIRSFITSTAREGPILTISDTSRSEQAQLIIGKSIEGKPLQGEARASPLAIALLKVQTDGFIKPMLYTGEGMGESGEIVLVDQEGWNLLSLKFSLPDGTRPKPLEYRAKAIPAPLAHTRLQDLVCAEDYRGVRVLAAYRHIKVNLDTDWGLIVKIDEAEVLGPLWHHAFWSLIVGLIGLVGIIALAAFSANKILRPIRTLSQVAAEVERGNFATRAHVASAGELAALTSTFNIMIDRVQNWHKEMERQVSDRTAQLNRLNEELTMEIRVRKRAEQALAAERQRLQVTLRCIGDGVITTDTDSKVVSLNTVGERLTGWKEAEAIGKPIHEVFHIATTDSDKPCDNPVHMALATGHAVELATNSILIARDGAHRIMADTCAPVRDEDGTVYGAVLIFRDVTAARTAEKALQESEERFRQLADNVQDVFWLTERGNPQRISYVNPAVKKVLGIAPEDVNKQGIAWLKLIHEEDRLRVAEAYNRFLIGRGAYDLEYRVMRADASLGWIWDRAFLVRDETGRVVRVAGLAQDITRRKIDEERQAQLVEEIKHFAYIVSHDLRAPLGNLKGFKIELHRSIEDLKPLARKAMTGLSAHEQQALSMVLEADIPESLAFIDASISRMSHLINAILNLSRLGRRELKFTRVNMDALVAETLQTMAHQVSQRNVVMQVRLLPEVVADRTSMEQIVSNLLMNAINYLDENRPGRVEMWSGTLGTDLAFHIRDNGVGIESAHLDKIFEMFQRCGKQDIQGEGMGLACVRTLVRRHGGRVWCDSEFGIGSTFTFTIPDLSPDLHVTEKQDASSVAPHSSTYHVSER